MSDIEEEIVPLYSVNEEQLIGDILKRRKRNSASKTCLAAPPLLAVGRKTAIHPFSGKNTGTWQMPAFAPFGWWPPGPLATCKRSAVSRHLMGKLTQAIRLRRRRHRPRTDDLDIDSSASEDHIDLLDDAEPLGMIESDLAVDPDDAWQAPKASSPFSISRSLSETERSAINKTFPKPSSKALAVPR